MTETAYDPSEHNAQQVLEHLAGADHDEQVRILDAERAGKARTTVLAFGSGDPAMDPDAVPADLVADPDGYTRVELPVDGTKYE